MVKRFLWIYGLMCVVPFLILGILAANVTGDAVTDELINAAQVGLEESASAIINLTREAREFSLEIADDAALQKILTEYMQAESPAEMREALTRMNSIMNHLGQGKLNMIVRICLVNDETAPKWDNTDQVMLRPEGEAEPWLREALENPRRFSWSMAAEGEAAMLRQTKVIYSTETWQALPAVLIVDIRPERLRAISLSQSYVSGRLYIVDRSGQIIYPYYNYDAIPEELLKSPTGIYDFGTQKALIRQISDVSWNLIRIVDPAGIRAQTADRRRLIVAVSLVLMIFSVLAAVYITLRVTRPIVRLSRHMKGVRAGKIIPIQEKQRIAEIRELYDSYDYMVEALNTQIEETYVSRIREREADLRALQAQINPHFLYNTLDSINWLAIRYKAEDISQMVVALSDMLRFSLNQGKNLIRVRDELKQVESYLLLQRIRYSGSFNYTIEAGESVRQRMILKMLLQPIVENAIIHGFEGKQDGWIWIHVWEEFPLLHIEIRNNGHPVDPEEMWDRLNGRSAEENTGYGIVNVNERLHGQYGHEYGLTYRVEDGLTVAAITIPVDEEGTVC